MPNGFGRLTRGELDRGRSLHSKLANDENATAADATAFQDWLTTNALALLGFADDALFGESIAVAVEHELEKPARVIPELLAVIRKRREEQSRG